MLAMDDEVDGNPLLGAEPEEEVIINLTKHDTRELSSCFGLCKYWPPVPLQPLVIPNNAHEWTSTLRHATDILLG